MPSADLLTSSIIPVSTILQYAIRGSYTREQGFEFAIPYHQRQVLHQVKRIALSTMVMKTESEKSKDDYCALSYTWGSQNNSAGSVLRRYQP
jgi:hypothetical protein